MKILVLLFSLSVFAAPSPHPLVKQVSRLRFEVSRKAVQKDIHDPLAQLSTFTALPSFGEGFFSGIALSKFSKNCLLPRFGLKDGDVIEVVNGQPIRGPGDILEVGKKVAQLPTGAKVRVQIRRGEGDVVQTYLLVE